MYNEGLQHKVKAGVPNTLGREPMSEGLSLIAVCRSVDKKCRADFNGLGYALRACFQPRHSKLSLHRFNRLHGSPSIERSFGQA